MRIWRQQTTPYDKNRAFRALHDFEGQAQIIEAEADERVAHQTVQNYVDAVRDKQKLQYRVMKNAPHSLINDALQHEYEELLIDWVQSLPGAN